jgi:hypothetical protein
MEIVLRFEKNELCIDHQEDSIGFTVLTHDNLQLDFSIDIQEWNQLKKFIDDSVWKYEQELKDQKN